LHEQRYSSYVHGQNFYHALDETERLGISHDIAGITESMAFFAGKSRNFAEAERLFRRLAEHDIRINPEGEASTYHQLGMIAHHQHDFATAEKWYLKSLEIMKKQRDEHGAAKTHHHLGMIALRTGTLSCRDSTNPSVAATRDNVCSIYSETQDMKRANRFSLSFWTIGRRPRDVIDDLRGAFTLPQSAMLSRLG
jgi:tetratricopeptide (TPR) repeat protein